ncbi:hypothetical protein ABK040_003258 [Willaertia magna]
MNSQTAAMNERQQMNESVVFLTAEMLELSSKGNNMILPISLNNYFVVSGGRDSICNSFLLTDQLLLQERRNKRRKKRFNNQTNIYSNNTCNNNTCMNNHNNSNSSGSYYGTPIKRTTSALTSTTLSSSLLLETNPSHSNDNISSNTSTTTTPTIINNDNNDNSITNSSERMLTPTREKRVRFQEGTSTANNNNSNNSRTASPVVATTTTSILKTSPRSGSTVTNSTTTTTNGSIETKNGNKVEITTTTINNNNLSMECKSNKKEERNGKEIGSTNTNNNNNNEKSLLIANKPTRSKSSSFDERKIPSNVNDLKSVEIPIRHASTSTLPTSVATTKGTTTSKLINLKETKSCMHTSKSVGDCSSCALLTDDFDCGCACDYNISNHNAKDSFCLNKRKRQHYQLKIAVVGPENSGKSALIKQYLTHTFLEFHDNTIQDNYSKIIAKTDKEVVELYITDTAGSEEYSCLRDSYIKENLIFVCVLDVTDEKSLDKLKIILEEILNKKRETIPILLVANKVDKKERVITKQQIKKFMWNDLKLKFNLSAYLETSAKNNFHVDKLFDKVLQLMDNYNCFFNSDNNQFQFSSIHFNNHNHHYTTQEDETNSECSDIDDELVNNWMVKKKKEEDVNSKKELLVSSASNLSKWLGQSFLKRSKSIGSNLFKLNK